MLRSIWIPLALGTVLLAAWPANVAGQPTPQSVHIQLSQLTRSAVETCTPVRLDQPPGLMARIPVADQASTSFCWAYAANQMVDAWRIKTLGLSTSSTSALSSAFGYLAHERVSNYDENGSTSMFKYLSSVPFLKLCDRSLIPDLDAVPAQVSKDIFNQIRLLHSNLRSVRTTPQNDLIAALSRAFPSIPPSRLASIPADKLRAWATEGSWTTFAARAKEHICAEHFYTAERFPTPSVLYTYQSTNVIANIERMWSSINRHLSSFHPTRNPNVLPIGVQFCSEILITPKEPSMLASGRLDLGACRGVMHTAVIVGRRPATWTNRTTGERVELCQYLVRNSEGPGCAGFDRPSDVFAPSNKCESGQMWIDEITLKGNTDVAYFVRE